METKPANCNFNFKETWRDIIKFLHVSDLFNLELVNRDLKEKVNSVYIKRNQNNQVLLEDKYKLNKKMNKKLFFKYYMNSITNFSVGDIEFKGEPEKGKDEEKPKNSSNNNSKKELPQKMNPTLTEDRYTAKEFENRIFYK